MKHIKRTCTPYHFAIDNLFSELSTEAQKQIARKNLGVSDEHTLYWGNIKGHIEDQEDFIDKLQELVHDYGLVISDTVPDNTNVIWYDTTSDYDLNKEGNLHAVRSSIKTLEDQMAQVMKILNYGVIAGDSSVGARTKMYSSAVPINPTTGEAEEEYIEPEGLSNTVPNISVKCDTLENFSKNRRNLIDGELIWVIDKSSLYIYYSNKFIPISNNLIGELPEDDDMTQEDIEKLYFNYLGFTNKNQEQYKLEVNENGNIIVYNSKNYDGNIGNAQAYGSYISDYLRINSVFIGGSNTKLDSFSACSHNFVELANASSDDINLYGIHLLYLKPGSSVWENLPLKGIIKAGSTFLIRGERCSYKSNITLDVEDYDMQWRDASGKLIQFDAGGGCFYLVCSNEEKFHNGTEWKTLSELERDGFLPYNKDTTPTGYIDLVGIKSSETDKTVHGEGGGPISIRNNENIRKCIFVRSFTLDPCSQAQKAHNKKSSSSLWTYVNMETHDSDYFPYYSEQQKHLYVPKSSKHNKNIFGTRTTFKENVPNMVNITFGRQATDNGSGATRCFNWISAGYYDEYIEYKKTSDTWDKALTKKSISIDNYELEYTGDTNVATFIKIYNRIQWVTTNNTPVTTHKVILRGLGAGTYNYRIRRTNDPDYISEVFQFTVRTDADVNNGFEFAHTTDQQAFNFYEYQAWTKAAKAINTNHPNIQFTLNTGDCTQNGNRESEWLDYYNGRKVLRNIEEMYVIGNNDLCGIIPYELGDGNASKYKINHKNIQYYFTYELDENNPAVFKFVKEGLDISKMGEVLEGDNTMFKYYMPSLFSFNYGKYHFIGLNSEFAANTYRIYYDDSAYGDLIKQHAYYNMYKWLVKDVTINSGKNHVAFMHEIPFCIIVGDSATDIAKARTIDNGSKLNHSFVDGVKYTEGTDNANYTGGCNFSEFFQNNNIKLALGGHKHTYSLSYPTKENITYSGTNRTVNYNNPIINEGGTIYSMCQATGYKLVSNKELPGTGISWLRKYFPMSKGSAVGAQYYPMYSVINTSGNNLTLKSYAVHNIFNEKTAFNINNQYIDFPTNNSTLINLADDPAKLDSITINY